ncbi:CDK2-associated and cullin domain-containing protein 1 [Mactra antiquata]
MRFEIFAKKMDEPMDDMCVVDSTQPEIGNEQPKITNSNPLLRPGSMVMMTITAEDYETFYWPKLERAINQLLTMTPGQYIPISYEQMYSCVYKCVCKQFSERLYQDLLQYMSSHLSSISVDLQNLVLSQTPSLFIEKFSFILNQYIQALGGIVPIFNYMNRFYVETKLKTDLNEELLKLFRTSVVDTHISFLLSLLEEANTQPFSVPPPTMSCLIKNLHSLNPAYAKMRPHLFSKFIPNIHPPTNVAELDKYVEETKLLQQEIHSLPGFDVCDSSSNRKRPNEEDVK